MEFVKNSYIYGQNFRGVAQPGLARFVRDEEVVGSNPITPTNFTLILAHSFLFLPFQVRRPANVNENREDLTGY